MKIIFKANKFALQLVKIVPIVLYAHLLLLGDFLGEG